MNHYLETFDHGTAGWWGWRGNFERFQKLAVTPGVVANRSPWWVDYNHAPPGSGYLHMIFCLNTKGPFGEEMKEAAGPNGFVNRGCPRNFTNASLTFTLKGELETRGANLVLLVQASQGGICSGWALTGQPLRVTPDWTEQTIRAVPDEKQWACLGARHDREDYYGRIDLATVLNDVNTNIMLILFPLTIAPMGPIEGDPHVLRAGRDYPLWLSRLPEGYVMMDTVKIEPAKRLKEK